MFPDERHVKIVQRLNSIEARLYGLYRALEGLRADLQEEWKVLPDGSRWSESRHEASLHSSIPEPKTEEQAETVGP